VRHGLAHGNPVRSGPVRGRPVSAGRVGGGSARRGPARDRGGCRCRHQRLGFLRLLVWRALALDVHVRDHLREPPRQCPGPPAEQAQQRGREQQRHGACWVSAAACWASTVRWPASCSSWAASCAACSCRSLNCAWFALLGLAPGAQHGRGGPGPFSLTRITRYAGSPGPPGSLFRRAAGAAQAGSAPYCRALLVLFTATSSRYKMITLNAMMLGPDYGRTSV
jgi:hypothetical protein